MASRLNHSLSQDYFCSELLHSGVASTPATHPLSFSAPYGQIMNFSRLQGNIFTGGRVEPGLSMQVGLSGTHCTESRPTVIGGVSPTLTVPGRGRKEKAVAIQTVCEIAGTSSWGAETEPVQVQPAMEREATIAEIMETRTHGGSTSRKRSRAAETHNISERRRREKINEKMKALQELIPRCNKSHRVSMLDDAIDYMKSLQMQTQMMSPGCGMMPPPMMYAANMQQFMPHAAMGMMGMNRPPLFIPFPGTPFQRQAHMTGLGPSYPAPRYPFPNVQASDPSRVHLPSPQPGSNPVSNQPQFPTYMNPYSQLVGIHQMQQPPPLQSQTTLQLSFKQASSSKEPGDQGNQPMG